MMSEIPLTIVGISYLLIAVTSLPSGLLLASLLRPEWFRTCGYVPSLILVLALGLSCNIALWWVVSLISVSVLTLFLVPCLPLIALGSYFAVSRKIGAPELRSMLARFRKGFSSPINAVFLLLLVVSIAQLASLVSYVSWSQAGDPWFHGYYILAIMEQGKLPVSFAPYDSSLVSYPLGYHVLVAQLCLILGVPAGIEMIVVASYAMVLITLVPPVLVLSRTKSIPYSVAAYLFCFYIHPVEYAQNSIYMNFVNGTYPVVLGVLMTLSLLSLFSGRSQKESPDGFRAFLIWAVLSLGILVTYPTFVIVAGVLFALVVFERLRTQGMRSGLVTRRKVATATFIILLGVLGALSLTLGPFSYIFVNLGFGIIWDYLLQPTYFLSILYIPMLVFAVLECRRMIKAGSCQSESLAFLILLSCTLISMVPYLFAIGLRLILPTRMMMLLQLWSFVYAAAYLHSKRLVLGDLTVELRVLKSSGERYLRLSGTIYQIALVAFVAVSMTPTIWGFATGSEQSKAAYWTRSGEFQNDLAGGYYIRDHAGYEELILNYETASDWGLPSLGIRNLVFLRPLDNASKTRAFEFESFWSHPDNVSLVKGLLLKYGIQLIYLSSPDRIVRMIVDNTTFIPRPVSSVICHSYFSTYSFLYEVFHKGNCSIFEVV